MKQRAALIGLGIHASVSVLLRGACGAIRRAKPISHRVVPFNRRGETQVLVFVGDRLAKRASAQRWRGWVDACHVSDIRLSYAAGILRLTQGSRGKRSDKKTGPEGPVLLSPKRPVLPSQCR